MSRRCCPRRNTSSAKKSGDQRSDHPSKTGQQAIMFGRINIREGWDKRELEICYHHIECSVSNSLAALMWKWYLSSNFQPYSYPQRFQKGANRTSIKKISNLTYTWRVEMKEAERIWKRITHYKEDHQKKQKKTKLGRTDYVPKSCNFCISLREIYKNKPSSNLIDENFSCSKLFVLFFPLLTNQLWSLST